MYNGQGRSAQNPNAYNYDSLFGSENNAYSSQQYQQYLNALNQYNPQQPTNPSVAAGYAATMSSMMESYSNNFSAGSVPPPPSDNSTTQHYSSFEQAMQQARIDPSQNAGFKMFREKRNYFGKNNMQGVSGFQKRKGPSKPPVDPKKYYCETCNISCANPQAFQDHNNGKSHKRKEELLKGNIQALAKNRSSFKCEVCNVTTTGKDSFETHINGIKHAKSIKNLQLLGKPIPENISTIIPPSNPNAFKNGGNFDGIFNPETYGMFDAPTEENMQPIGEEFIEALEGCGKQTQFKCKLCECTCGDVTAKNLHIRGRRHRLAYKQKVDHSIYVDAKPNARNTKLRKQFREKEMKITTFPSSWCVAPQGTRVLYAVPDTFANDSFDDQHVCAKLESLRAYPKLVEETDKLMSIIETSLRKTSDLLTQKLNSDIEQDADAIDKNRVLRGVIRTGILGDRLLINSDRQLTAVLICKDIPTVGLLQDITSTFKENIEEEELRTKIVVEDSIEDSGFRVKFNDGEMSCLIVLSSFELDENFKEEDTSAENSAMKEKPADVLPISPMVLALSTVRQSKFFQSQCWPVGGLCEVVVLLRDLFSRRPIWNVLSLHAIKILVYEFMSACPVPRPSDSFRRFFEAVASGQFMSPHSKLVDPCEKNEVDLMALVNSQQRENLMENAQQIVRLIAFDQIYSVLGIDRLPVLNRKRPSENIQEDDNDSKKEKKSGEPESSP